MKKKKYISRDEKEQYKLNIVSGTSVVVCVAMIVSITIMVACLVAKVVLGI